MPAAIGSRRASVALPHETVTLEQLAAVSALSAQLYETVWTSAPRLSAGGTHQEGAGAVAIRNVLLGGCTLGGVCRSEPLHEAFQEDYGSNAESVRARIRRENGVNMMSDIRYRLEHIICSRAPAAVTVPTRTEAELDQNCTRMQSFPASGLSLKRQRGE